MILGGLDGGAFIQVDAIALEFFAGGLAEKEAAVPFRVTFHPFIHGSGKRRGNKSAQEVAAFGFHFLGGLHHV
jgi:hypothetical protein